MSDKIDTTDGARDKNIKKDMREMNQRYDRYHYPGIPRVQHRGGQSDYEKCNSKHNEWSRGTPRLTTTWDRMSMTWASTWEMMNRTLEAFATRNTDSSDRGSNKSRKTFKKPKEFKDDSDGCIDTWVGSHEVALGTIQLER